MSAPTMNRVRTTGQSLVSPEFFERLKKRVESLHDLDEPLARGITDQALAYLATCAQKPPRADTLYMSPLVDLGWHCFLEYTREYDAFFANHGWPKVHHNPCDEPGVAYGALADLLPLTAHAIKAAGFYVDEPLWSASRVDCGDTCGDDGGGGNPPDCGHTV
ncbi:hypothetical protein ACWEV4_02325 [Streptomyces sp. NPDC003860]